MKTEILKTLVCLLVISLGYKCATSTPTPPLPGSVTQTLTIDQSVLLNPTATYHPPSSSVYMGVNSGMVIYIDYSYYHRLPVFQVYTCMWLNVI